MLVVFFFNDNRRVTLLPEVIMPEKSYLTVDEFRKMWKIEVLPSTRREVKFEIETLNARYPVNFPTPIRLHLLVNSPT